jgi:ATP-binding cassette, subfamily C, bacterial CydC
MRDLLPFLSLYRRHWLLLSAGLILTLFTLLAGIGLLSLSGWFLSAAAIAGMTLLGRQDFNYLFPAGAVRFLSIVRTAGRWGDRVVTHDATFRLLTRLRILFWEKLAPLPAASLQSFRQGDLLNRLVADIDAMDHVYLRLVTPLITALLTLLAVFVFLQRFDLALAQTLTISLLLIGLLLPALLYRLGRQPGRQLAQSRSTLRIDYLDYVENQAELLLFGAESQQRERLLQTENQMIDAQRRMNLLTGLSTALLTLSAGLLLLLMLWLSADGLGSRGPDPLIALMVFITLAAFEAINPLVAAFQHLATTLTSARRLNEVLQEAEPLQYGSRELAPSTATVTLALHNIHFGYPEQPEVLSGLNLQLAAGEKVAILGPTGCGKSTLLGLITREWSARQGELSLNGEALATLDEASLRASMAVVSQRVHIFSATLGDNLRLAHPLASDEELCAILHAVGLQDLLQGDSPRKALSLWLGEGGRPLSGGEQRRLGLARALLHRGPLLLLDEPTEGLDPATEQSILALIFQHAAGKSLLMITHRLSGLEQMDRVLRLEQGQLHPVIAN